MKDLTEAQQKRLAGIKLAMPTRHSVFLRAYSGKSRSSAVKAMCLDCVGLQKQFVTECTATACPLWAYRPYVKRAKRSKKIPLDQP